MKQKILQTIKEHDLLKKNMHVVVGLSGGPDSMCLFDVLCQLAEPAPQQVQYGELARCEANQEMAVQQEPAPQDQGENVSALGLALKLYPVHVNHQFRPGAAEKDQAFVEKFCRDRGWPCRSFVVDCNAMAKREGLTSEEAGRKARYQAFRQVADEIVEGGVKRENVVIAVAQNANDQCETILFRLLRGTGVDGIAGIAYKRWDESGTAVVRPLLDVCRAEIEEYCESNHLAPRRDHTNAEPTYARNRIRLELIPFLKKNYSQNVIDVVNRLGELAAVDREYLWMQAEEAYQNARQSTNMRDSHSADLGSGRAGFVDLDCGALASLHPAIRSRVYGRALGEIGLKEDVTAAHIAGLDRILESGRPSAAWNLPDGFMAVRRYGVMRLQRKFENDENIGTIRLSQIDDANYADNIKDEKMTDPDIPQSMTNPDATHSTADFSLLRVTVPEGQPGQTGLQVDAYLGQAAGQLRAPASRAGDTAETTRLEGDGGETVEAARRTVFDSNARQAVFDLDALEATYGEGAAQQITLRRRQQGDYMQIRIGGALHRKKLQDIFVDMKMPKEDRDHLLLAAIGKEILWILPVGCESHVKIGRNGRFSAAYSAFSDQVIRRIVLEYL